MAIKAGTAIRYIGWHEGEATTGIVVCVSGVSVLVRTASGLRWCDGRNVEVVSDGD